MQAHRVVFILPFVFPNSCSSQYTCVELPTRPPHLCSVEQWSQSCWTIADLWVMFQWMRWANRIAEWLLTLHWLQAEGRIMANKSIYDFSVETLDGQVVPLGIYRGKVLLIVNVATFWGSTIEEVIVHHLVITHNQCCHFLLKPFDCVSFFLSITEWMHSWKCLVTSTLPFWDSHATSLVFRHLVGSMTFLDYASLLTWYQNLILTKNVSY